MFRPVRSLVLLAVLASSGGWLYYSGLTLRDLAYLVDGSPHERYTVALKYRGVAATAGGRAWLESAEQSLVSAKTVKLPLEDELELRSAASDAVAYTVRLRRGQRYIISTAATTTPARGAVFVDLFEHEGDDFRHIESAVPGFTAAAVEIRSDGHYVVRVQPELNHDVHGELTLRVEPTLRVPVEHSKAASIQSLFGDARDGGRRRHHGIDIFAKRGTPVVAAADGVVSSVGTNGLGGKVVWVARPRHREMHYYAHLDRQLVEPGTLVKAGDVLGTVGNTGNARRTPPHLHFGIYSAGGPVDPLPYIAPRG